MRLSVVIPLYNCLELTQAMVASLRATLPSDLDHEIILVDDGSTDGTRHWLAALGSPFRVILNDRNRGYGAANNRGAAAATGEYLALLNNDLVLTPGWLEPMMDAHRRLGSRAGIVGNVQIDAKTGGVDHAGIFINYKGKPEHVRSRPPGLFRFLFPLRPVSAMTGACILIERSLWQMLGGFDESYMNGCEDVDLCLRAAAAGRTNAIALRSSVFHHISQAPGRKSRDEANSYRFALKWQDTLISLGLHDWCRHQFEACLAEPQVYPDPILARQLFWYMARLRRRMPSDARSGMRAALALELDRWRAMAGQ